MEFANWRQNPIFMQNSNGRHEITNVIISSSIFERQDYLSKPSVFGIKECNETNDTFI